MMRLSPSPSPTLMMVISLLIILPLIAFWLWMFREMIDNDHLPGSAKETWTLTFLVLNVFAAVIYYVTEYRRRD